MQNNIKIKKHYQNKYTTIDNILINDMSLSFKAKGVFLYFWSKPDDWDSYAKETGNNPLNKISIPRNHLEKMIDNATGYAEQQYCDMLKFAIWFAEGFLEGCLNAKNI